MHNLLVGKVLLSVFDEVNQMTVNVCFSVSCSVSCSVCVSFWVAFSFLFIQLSAPLIHTAVIVMLVPKQFAEFCF